MFPELWRDERLEPHKPKALFLQAFDEGNVVVDVSEVFDTKIAAMKAHRSQFGEPGIEKMVRFFAREIGKRSGYEYGESWRIIRLDQRPMEDA